MILVIVGSVGYFLTRGPTVTEEEKVHIGFMGPMTGGVAYLGDICFKGVQMAVDEINEQGGIESLGGAKIELHVYDSGATADEAVRTVERMIDEHRGELSAIIQPWPSGYVLASVEVTEREKIPMACSAWVDGLTEMGYEYIFRWAPRSSYIVESAMPSLIEMLEEVGLQIDKIAFTHDDNPATIGLGEALRDKVCPELGKELVLLEMWSPPLTDAGPIIAKVLDSGADIHISYSISISDIIMMVSKEIETRMSIPSCYYGGGLINPQFKGALGTLTEGLLALTDWAIMKGAEEIEQNYIEKFGGTWMPKDAGLMYGAAWTIKEALEEAGDADPTAVRDALSKLRITDPTHPAFKAGWGTPIEFEANGDIKGPVVLVAQWQGPNLVVLYPTEVATGTLITPEERLEHLGII